ncbi:MAG: lipid-A-disaccharide synthase [Flavobacteriales bacterium]|nr:lipid-A-disaccharide synthase [Flavobacteriales bacterium]
MKFYIIAGEASGDLHAPNLMKALKAEEPDTQFRFWGGDLMLKQDKNLVKHYRDLAFMGFTEVLLNLKTIKANIRFCKQDVLDYQPDALILVDYPGFNLRIAQFAKSKGINIFYYISPKVWAWNQKRAIKIKSCVDEMFTIFPFETAFYKKYNFNVNYVGHPLLDAIDKTSFSDNEKVEFLQKNNLNSKPIIALLPGSRKQEVTRILSVMLSVQSSFSDYQFVIGGAPSLPKEFYQPFLSDDTTIIFDQTYDLLKMAKAALVTSGTATLETAIFGVPQVVCYKAGTITYHIAKRLINVKFISLVNLILDTECVTELIQDELNTERLTEELQKIIGHSRERQLNDYQKLRQLLGDSGASLKTASLMLKTLKPA